MAAATAEVRCFYLGQAFGAGSLFDVWERGDAWGDSVTPSTYDPRYRTWIVEKLQRHLAGGCLALGCGNGVVEAELVRRGHVVLAIDILEQAVSLARQKGVDAVVADARSWRPPRRNWSVVYADGFLGHVYEPATGCTAVLRRIRRWLAPCGTLLLSNDAPPDGEHVDAAEGVPGFYWLSGDHIAGQLESAGFEVEATEEFVYERPVSGPRRRAVVTARPASTDSEIGWR